MCLELSDDFGASEELKRVFGETPKYSAIAKRFPVEG